MNQSLISCAGAHLQWRGGSPRISALKNALLARTYLDSPLSMARRSRHAAVSISIGASSVATWAMILRTYEAWRQSSTLQLRSPGDGRAAIKTLSLYS
jgi:hypothetical protein